MHSMIFGDTVNRSVKILFSNCLLVRYIYIRIQLIFYIDRKGFPAGAVEKVPTNAGDARDAGSIPGSGRSPGEGNGNPLQYSCLENSMDRGAWQAAVRGVAKSQNDWAQQ